VPRRLPGLVGWAPLKQMELVALWLWRAAPGGLCNQAYLSAHRPSLSNVNKNCIVLYISVIFRAGAPVFGLSSPTPFHPIIAITMRPGEVPPIDLTARCGDAKTGQAPRDPYIRVRQMSSCPIPASEFNGLAKYGWPLSAAPFPVPEWISANGHAFSRSTSCSRPQAVLSNFYL